MKKRFSKMKKEREEVDVDITSLLDVLVILLVFLLKSYNASDLKLEPVSGLTMAGSDSRKFGNHSLVVQINKDKKVWVNSKEIGHMQADEEKILNLYEELKIQKEKDKQELATQRKIASKANPKKENINLVIDQELPYSVVRKVMHTAAMAGYPKFKFIVQGNY